jgi:hypothetical protein
MMNHIKRPTMASPATTAPPAIPPVAFGPDLEDASAAGGTLVVETGKYDSNVGAVLDVKSVVGANADVDAAIADVDRGAEPYGGMIALVPVGRY